MKPIDPKLLPASLRRFASKVEDFSDERNTGDGLWLYLLPGLSFEGEVHMVHEDTCKECIQAFRNVVECNCEECVRLINEEKANV